MCYPDVGDGVRSFGCDVDEARIDALTLRVKGFRSVIAAEDLPVGADGYEFSVIDSKGSGLIELTVNGIDVGVMDNKVNLCLAAGKHRYQYDKIE